MAPSLQRQGGRFTYEIVVGDGDGEGGESTGSEVIGRELTLDKFTGWLTSKGRLTLKFYRFRVKATRDISELQFSNEDGSTIDVMLQVVNATQSGLKVSEVMQ